MSMIEYALLYGIEAAVGLVVAAVLALYLLGRRHRYFLPRGILGWVAAVPALAVGGLAAYGLFFVATTEEVQGGFSGYKTLDAFNGTPAPELSFELLGDGRRQQLSDYRGRVVLVNFWATTCGACIGEMPDMVKLQQQHADDLVVLHISDEGGDALMDFLARRPMGAEHAAASDFDDMVAPYSELNKIGRPITMVVDREGTIRRSILGARGYEFFAEVVAAAL